MAGERPTFSIEYPCHSPAEQRWFLMQVDPMPPEQGGVVISHVNITERRRADEALRESEKRFRVTFEQAAVGVAHSSLDGRLLLMNQKLCDILGYTPEEILTKDLPGGHPPGRPGRGTGVRAPPARGRDRDCLVRETVHQEGRLPCLGQPDGLARA